MKSMQWQSLLNEAITKPGILSNAYRAFHNYSIGNQLLAWSQLHNRNLPIAPIATFKQWQAKGRNVKKGEKAIALYMPLLVPKRDNDGNKTENMVQIFTLKNYWFSLDQTQGEEYAEVVEIPDWNPEKALAALDIAQISYESTNGNCQGYASGRTIAINPLAVLPHKTRFHEMAHVVLGHTLEHTMTDSETTPRDIREVEAESVAYILCSILELPGLNESRGYIQNWLSGSEITDKTAQRIFSAAEKILKAGK
jgi:antirestriction protein ArdC